MTRKAVIILSSCLLLLGYMAACNKIEAAVSIFVNGGKQQAGTPDDPLIINGANRLSLGNILFWQKMEESVYNNIIKENRYLLIWNGLKNTALISLLSVIFGTFA